MNTAVTSHDESQAQGIYVSATILFEPGAIVLTPNADKVITDKEWVIPLLIRHISGDWGACSAEEKIANDEAVRGGDRVVSVYTLPNDERVKVLTEADRTVTTFLLSAEY